MVLCLVARSYIYTKDFIDSQNSAPNWGLSIQVHKSAVSIKDSIYCDTLVSLATFEGNGCVGASCLQTREKLSLDGVVSFSQAFHMTDQKLEATFFFLLILPNNENNPNTHQLADG